MRIAPQAMGVSGKGNGISLVLSRESATRERSNRKPSVAQVTPAVMRDEHAARKRGRCATELVQTCLTESGPKKHNLTPGQRLR